MYKQVWAALLVFSCVSVLLVLGWLAHANELSSRGVWIAEQTALQKKDMLVNSEVVSLEARVALLENRVASLEEIADRKGLSYGIIQTKTEAEHRHTSDFLRRLRESQQPEQINEQRKVPAGRNPQIS